MAERDPDLSSRRNYPAYEADYAAWLEAQAGLMRERRFDELDLENLLDEVKSLSLSTYKAFVSAIRVVLIHMLKWDIQEDRRSRSWQNSIEEHRRRVTDELNDSPSFAGRVEAALVLAYRQARAEAAEETGLPLRRLPKSCPYGWNDVMNREHSVIHDPSPKIEV
jgi:hypothetical protein